MKHGLAFVTSLLLFASAALGTPVSAEGGLGVYPSIVELTNAARGAEYYRDVGILNSAEADRAIKIEPEGEVGNWVTFHNIDDRATPLQEVNARANQETRLLMRIRVPETASNQDYRGGITLRTYVSDGNSADGQAATGVSIGLAMDLRVVVSGVQVMQGRVRELHSEDTEVGYPLRIKTFFENTGNVRAKPQVNYVIKSAAGAHIADGSIANTVVHPGENGIITAEWDTTGQPAGDFRMIVAITLADLQIHTDERPFKILPRGTLTRQGLFTGFALASKPIARAATKVSAGFRNIGQIDTRAVFIGELYRGDVLIQAVMSPEKLVPKGADETIEVFLNSLEPGAYTLRGKVNFEGKESGIQELNFTVDSELPAMGTLGSVGAWALVTMGVVVALVRRSRRRRNSRALGAT